MAFYIILAIGTLTSNNNIGTTEIISAYDTMMEECVLMCVGVVVFALICCSGELFISLNKKTYEGLMMSDVPDNVRYYLMTKDKKILSEEYKIDNEDCVIYITMADNEGIVEERSVYLERKDSINVTEPTIELDTGIFFMPFKNEE